MSNELGKDIIHVSILVTDPSLLLDLPEPSEEEIREGVSDFVDNYYNA